MKNYIGVWTLYKKEVLRFIKVYHQTVISPVISAITFLMVFCLATGGHRADINNIPFREFIFSGLIIMSIVQNSFANTSSVMVMGKVMGNIYDYVIPPFSAFELTFALVMGGITRGIIVGLSLALVLYPFIPVKIYDPLIVIFFGIFAAMLLALFGILVGLLANNFDQMSAVTNYLVTPLSFLSGTFYSTLDLHPLMQKISLFNPFLYMIDGFRFGITGHSEVSPKLGALILAVSIITIWSIVFNMFKKGIGIKD